MAQPATEIQGGDEAVQDPAITRNLTGAGLLTDPAFKRNVLCSAPALAARHKIHECVGAPESPHPAQLVLTSGPRPKDQTVLLL